MLTSDHIKEGLSRAYISAVAHRAGFNMSFTSFDYGMDGTFIDVKVRNGRYVDSGFKIDFQAKASQDCTFDGKHCIFHLKNKNYNDLADPATGTPRILILLSLPQQDSDWLSVSIDQLTMKRAVWWASLKGQPFVEEKDSKKTVKIPIDQRFDVAALVMMMDRCKKGEAL